MLTTIIAGQPNTATAIVALAERCQPSSNAVRTASRASTTIEFLVVGIQWCAKVGIVVRRIGTQFVHVCLSDYDRPGIEPLLHAVARRIVLTSVIDLGAEALVVATELVLARSVTLRQRKAIPEIHLIFDRHRNAIEDAQECSFRISFGAFLGSLEYQVLSHLYVRRCVLMRRLHIASDERQ